MMKLGDGGSIDRVDRPVAQGRQRMPPKQTPIFGDGAPLDLLSVLFQKPIRDFPKSQNRPLLLPHLGQIPTGGYLAEHAFCLLSRRIWRPCRAVGSEGKPVISAANPTL